MIRPPHSPTPVPILTVSGAADAKANSLQMQMQIGARAAPRDFLCISGEIGVRSQILTLTSPRDCRRESQSVRGNKGRLFTARS
jgi:hypothetical protein